jgi:hypothetical protein
VKPIFLDFEASGLTHESFPIQVAWGSAQDDVACHYIKPATRWTYWSLDAEAIHGIAPERLNEGLAPGEICERMNAALAGQAVYADGLPMDQFWLSRLYDAGNLRPTFELRNALDLFCDAIPVRPSLAEALLSRPEHLRIVQESVFDEIMNRARGEIPGRRHRADVDTRYLIRAWEMIQGVGGEGS